MYSPTTQIMNTWSINLMDGHDPKKEGSKSFITAHKRDLKTLEFAFNFNSTKENPKISEVIFLSSVKVHSFLKQCFARSSIDTIWWSVAPANFSANLS